MWQHFLIMVLAISSVGLLLANCVAYHGMRVIEHEVAKQRRLRSLQLSYDAKIFEMRKRAVIIWTCTMLAAAICLMVTGYVGANI
jgi:hypothetical protein